MNINKLFKSSVGLKFIMAITGMAMFLFVVAHMVGNLQVFLGAEEINRYGAFLQGNVELLWPARIGLLLIISLHIWSAVRLTAENRAARPQAYARHDLVVATYASRTMMMSGLIIFAFIIFHLLHYTVQVPAVNMTGQDFRMLEDSQHRHDVFKMIILGFRNPLVSVFYVVAMGLLFLHLSHGVGAMFQSLGWRNPAYAAIIARFAVAATWLVFLGYVSIPIAVLFGYGSHYVGLSK